MYDGLPSPGDHGTGIPRRLLRRLGVELHPGETATVLALFGTFFFCLCFQYAAKSVRQASFVDSFGAVAYYMIQNVDADTASRYRAAFRDAGALLEIVPNGAPAPQRATPAPGTADAAVVGADTPTAPTPAAADDMSLAEPGAIIDHAPAAPPAEIDTSALSALPPNSGSLEDCKIDKEPHPIPDISHLQIVDD